MSGEEASHSQQQASTNYSICAILGLQDARENEVAKDGERTGDLLEENGNSTSMFF